LLSEARKASSEETRAWTHSRRFRGGKGTPLQENAFHWQHPYDGCCAEHYNRIDFNNLHEKGAHNQCLTLMQATAMNTTPYKSLS